MVVGTSLTCPYCTETGFTFFEHAFPWEHFSSPLLSCASFCGLHAAMYTAGVMMTKPADFLPQLPPESGEQRMQRETETAQYAALIADPNSEAGRWAAGAGNIRSREYRCWVCPQADDSDDDEDDPPMKHSRAQLHMIRQTRVRMPGSTAGVTPVALRYKHFGGPLLCEDHVWDVIRLLQFFDPRANGGKGNLVSDILPRMNTGRAGWRDLTLYRVDLARPRRRVPSFRARAFIPSHPILPITRSTTHVPLVFSVQTMPMHFECMMPKQ